MKEEDFKFQMIFIVALGGASLAAERSEAQANREGVATGSATQK